MKPSDHPVFLIGAPRTGSTIFYQILTNSFDILYPDNLVELFNRNIYFGFVLSDKVFRNKPHNCFKSDYGNTLKCGLRAPHECGSFWYRWLPKDQHYIEKGQIPSKHIIELRKNIYAIINRFKKPILFKNLNAGQRLGLISEIAPDAKFIWIKRDPLYTAQSIYIARQKMMMKSTEWWSVKPSNYLKLKSLEEIPQIVQQIFFIEKQISEDKNLFPEKNFMEIDYEQLFEDKIGIMNSINTFYNNSLSRRTDYLEAELNYSEKIVLEDKILKSLRKEIEKLDWNTYAH